MRRIKKARFELSRSLILAIEFGYQCAEEGITIDETFKRAAGSQTTINWRDFIKGQSLVGEATGTPPSVDATVDAIYNNGDCPLCGYGGFWFDHGELKNKIRAFVKRFLLPGS